nr:MAG TPA: hypothetical protein [Caudoviricetes sp.]
MQVALHTRAKGEQKDAEEYVRHGIKRGTHTG